MLKTATSCFLHGILLASVVGMGLPFVLAVSSAKPLKSPLSEGEKTSDAESDGFELEKLELFSCVEFLNVLTPVDFSERVIDRTVDLEAAFAIGHLERGPPLA